MRLGRLLSYREFRPIWSNDAPPRTCSGALDHDENPDGVHLLLEPNGSPVAQAYQQGLRAAGLPVMIFAVDDLAREHERLTGLGVTFTAPPVPTGPVLSTVLDDTCGNLVSLQQPLG
ncbi:hypothetical protein OG559_00110 [Micromonospora sp. NBC_01405]|uniref:VOC family protein n=1 Tax=Micromonospora sp. NBC_01405 TaxID=2903589 RepID=UPI00324318C6